MVCRVFHPFGFCCYCHGSQQLKGAPWWIVHPQGCSNHTAGGQPVPKERKSIQGEQVLLFQGQDARTASKGTSFGQEDEIIPVVLLHMIPGMPRYETYLFPGHGNVPGDHPYHCAVGFHSHDLFGSPAKGISGLQSGGGIGNEYLPRGANNIGECLG